MNLNQEQRDALIKAADILQEVGMSPDIVLRLRYIVARNTPVVGTTEPVHQVNAGDSGSGKDK